MKQKYGILLNDNIKINRQYFREMVKLLGVYCLFRAPKPGKKYTSYAEIDANYEEPILIGCIFEDHPTQQTMKKIGWVSELQQGSSIIHVDYDLEGLQQGALFIIPSGLDDGKARVFRVVRMATSIVYPASITCEIVPEYVDSFEEHTQVEHYDTGNIQILADEKLGPLDRY